MGNTDIIVFTSIVVVLFLVFFIASVREFNTMSGATFVEKKEVGPNEELFRMMGKFFTDDRIDPDKKITFMNAVKPIINDMTPTDEVKKQGGL